MTIFPPVLIFHHDAESESLNAMQSQGQDPDGQRLVPGGGLEPPASAL